MSLNTRVGLLAGATALTLTGVSVGGPATSDVDMAQRLAAAEAKIAELEAAKNQDWLTEQRAAEIRGLVQDVLADADARASLLQAGATAGYDNGFVLGDTSGNWLLRTNFLMQQRFIYNNQDTDEGSETDENRWGFENTRSKFILSGHVVNPSWYYLVSINVASPSAANFGDSRSGVGNAYLGYDYGNGWKTQVGSMKAPLLREELVEAQYQLAVERTNVNYLFTTGYTDGLMTQYQGDQFAVYLMASDGARRSQSGWSALDTEYAFSGRAEFLASGTWDQFKDFTSPQGGETGVLLGAAGHYERGEFGEDAVFDDTFGDEYEILLLTGDVSAEFGGFNLYGALVWADISDPDTLDSNPWGFVIQGGFYLNDTWELFGRYEFADIDDLGGAEDDINIITVGVNKYFAGHNAKWTTDVGFSLDSLETGFVTNSATITGFRPDEDENDGQFCVRTQLQILF